MQERTTIRKHTGTNAVTDWGMGKGKHIYPEITRLYEGQVWALLIHTLGTPG